MSRSYKNTTIAILLACILTMAIGYAVLNTRLSIEGTSKITSNFDVQIVGNKEISTSGFAETIDLSYNATSANFTTTLQAPGDKATYEIIIENKGNVNAYISANDITFNFINNDYIVLGIEGISLTPINWDTMEGYTPFNEYQLLMPGDRLYLYGGVVFKASATSLPQEKEFNFTLNFNFHGEGYFSEDISFKKSLYELILRNEPIVTNGTGLYKEAKSNPANGLLYDNYTYKSDDISDVNNYVSINGKLWRIISLIDERSNYNITKYKLIEDELTVNSDTAFSTVADAEGYYNDLSGTYSTLIKANKNYIRSIDPGFMVTYIQPRHNIFVYNSQLKFDYDFDTYSKFIPEIDDILSTSSKSSCSISTLSTGGCKSWLTNNGDTYLYNMIYSDESTNTGNIAYLQDGNVVSVDPQDTNYGKYKIFVEISSSCDFSVTNATVADGSRENPYILDTADSCETAH